MNSETLEPRFSTVNLGSLQSFQECKFRGFNQHENLV